MLEEVELFIASGGPEIVSFITKGLPGYPAIAIEYSYAASPSKGRVGENHIIVVAWRLFQAVSHSDGALVMDLSSDAVEVHVHEAEPGRLLHYLPAPESFNS